MIQDSLLGEKAALQRRTTRTTSGMISVNEQKMKSGIKSLAEAVILQCIEDLFDSFEKRNSIKFFKGEGFNVYAEIAGISTVSQIRIIRMLGNTGLRKSHQDLIICH